MSRQPTDAKGYPVPVLHPVLGKGYNGVASVAATDVKFGPFTSDIIRVEATTAIRFTTGENNSANVISETGYHYLGANKSLDISLVAESNAMVNHTYLSVSNATSSSATVYVSELE